MSNRILGVEIEPRSLDPVSAELRVIVHPERVTETTEVRGRLMGPSCPYASTVEIAYPLATLEKGPERVVCRVVIPEASLWDPQSPFLYAGLIDLWQDGQRSDRVQVRQGLRRFSLSPQGLRINGRLIALNGHAVEALLEGEAKRLREQGINLLLVPLRPEAQSIWDLAERLGFLVLGRIDPAQGPSSDALRQLERRASCLGWLQRVEEETFDGFRPGAGTFAVVARGAELVAGNVTIARLKEPVERP